MPSWFLTSVTISLVGALYVKFYKIKYWSRVGLYTIKTSFPFGFANPFLFKNLVFPEEVKSLYQDIKQHNQRHGGFYIFTKPIYMPVDPVIINKILKTTHLQERQIYHHQEKDKIYNSLYFADESKSVFLKESFMRINCSGIKEEYFKTVLKPIQEFIAKKDTLDLPKDINFLTAKMINDAFFDSSFSEEFVENMEKFSKPMESVNLKNFLGLVSHGISKIFFVRVSDKRSSQYFVDKLKEILCSESETKPSWIKKLQDGIEDIEDDQLLQHVVSIILGNCKSISSTVSFCLFELAKNKDSQDMLRNEVVGILKDAQGSVNLEKLLNAPYLDAVIKETLRKYPVVPVIKRFNNTAFTIPGSSVVLEEGIHVVVSINGLHNDEEYFPDPEEFDTARFLQKDFILSGTYLPFGGGARECIGKDFALIPIKLIIFLLLEKFSVELKNNQAMSLKLNSLFTCPQDFELNVKPLKS